MNLPALSIYIYVQYTLEIDKNLVISEFMGLEGLTARALTREACRPGKARVPIQDIWVHISYRTKCERLPCTLLQRVSYTTPNFALLCLKPYHRLNRGSTDLQACLQVQIYRKVATIHHLFVAQFTQGE